MIFASRNNYVYWHFDFINGDSGWLGGPSEDLGAEVGQEYVLTNESCIEDANGEWHEWYTKYVL